MIKRKKAPAIIERWDTNPETGLTAQQAAHRKAQELNNEQKVKTSKTYRAIFMRNIFTFFNMLWVIVAAILIWVGAYADCFFVLIVLANLLIGIIQEIKAKRMVEKLSLITAPTSQVIRDGRPMDLPTSEVVLDDIMILGAGKQVCTDSIVQSGSIEVNEALLTGESVAVKKAKGDMLLAGSFVTSGSCVARAERVGGQNYIQQLAKKAKNLKDPPSELLKSLKLLINVIGVLIIPLTAMVVLRNYDLLSGDLYTVITKSAGAVIGMIPSGMFLLTSVALMVGVINLAEKRTLVQDLYCIEMLARATVLCLDKTGTITDGTMNVRETVQLSSNTGPIEDILSSVLHATKDNNHTALALINRFGTKAVYPASACMPFSSARKASAVSFDGKGTYAVGAAEFILGDIPKELSARIKTYSMQGLRVLLVAHSKKNIVNDELPEGMAPQYLVLIEDHIRPDAAETIRLFKENNVKIKIISGDNPVTVSHVAMRVGVENADKFVSLDKMSDDDVTLAATKYTVFGRVSPEQKAVLINALKCAGETVAMTGDGVNDILSMKEADCSIAMASGSDATRNVANLVLLDSNFSAMPKVVDEGRRVINNIQLTSSLFLMKTFFVIMLITFFAVVPLALPVLIYAYPFNAKQMMILEILVIGMPSFFLALQPNHNLIKGKFLVTVIKKALPAAILMVINVMTLYIFAYFFHDAFGVSYDHIVTLCILCTTFIGFQMLGLTCYPFNRYRLIMFLTMIALAVISLLTFPNFFELAGLNWPMIITLTCMLIIDFPLLLLLVKAFKKIKIRTPAK